MKKFINEPQNLTRELLEGLQLSNPETIELRDNNLVVNRKLYEADRVTIVSLGGTGHEPALEGYVGEGMLDIAVPGEIFAAPGPQLCLEALKLADRGKGTLLLVFNHAGDVLTGNMAMAMAKDAGLSAIKIVTQEDAAGEPRESADDRRGLVGGVVLFKIAGAAAAANKPLEYIAQLAQRFADNMATIAVAARGATHPYTGDFISIIGEDEMEIGMGQHGEGGGKRSAMKSADETAIAMTDIVVKDLGLQTGERVMLVINGSGSTTLMELLIVFRKSYNYLKGQGIEVVCSWVDEILTVQEAAGFQLFIARMDDELLGYWKAPCRTPYKVEF